MPAEIDLKEVQIRQGEIDCFDGRRVLKDQIAHCVDGVLAALTQVCGEGLDDNLPRFIECDIEPVAHCSHLVHVLERLPLHAAIDLRAQHAVPSLLERGVLVADEAVELGISGFQYGQSLDHRVDGDALALCDGGFDVAAFGAVADEGVGVWFAVDDHSCPAVNHDGDRRFVDVAVEGDEVGADDGGEELWRGDGVLLGEDVNCILDAVGGYDGGVVAMSVGDVNFPLEHHSNGHLGDIVNTILTTVDLRDTDIVLAIRR